MDLYIAIAIFSIVFSLIVTELFDKALLASLGAVLMIFFGIENFREATAAIDFETIVLLMSMMILVGITKKAGIISWLSVKIAEYTKGSPLMIFVLFFGLTFLLSTFLGNVTTVLLIVPIILMLARGTGKDPKLYLLGVVFSANLGGAVSLVGDPSNIIIGSFAHLSFNDFIANLFLPVIISTLFIILLMSGFYWDTLQPIAKSLKKLFISHLMLERIKYRFISANLDKAFNIKVLSVLFLTVLGFVLEAYIPLPISLIPFFFAISLLILVKNKITVYEAFDSVEWGTIFFFIGLFIMVGGLEKVGLLQIIADYIINLTDSYVALVLLILTVAGVVSMVLDNVAFVTIMVPVVHTIQKNLGLEYDPTLLWWALSMGACLGANGTAIGSAANVVGLGIAKKEGVEVTFFEHLKFSLPMTLITLFIAAFYLFIRVNN